MKSVSQIACAIFLAGAFLVSTCTASTAAAQNPHYEAQFNARLTVTPNVNDSKKPPVLQQKDVTVLLKNRPAEITSWEPGSEGQLQLVLLFDNSLPGYVSLQFSSIRKFIDGLPPSAEVAVAYMTNGRADMAQTLTSNHAMASKALRLPNSMPGVSASPYFCLSDLAKHWPSQARARRVVLMITNGEDPYYRSRDLQDPYVAAAITDAQRAGLLVYSIYFRVTGGQGGSLGRLFGQSYLQRVSDQTGGQTFLGAMITPVSFDPYLAQFKIILDNQYMATIAAQGSGLQPVKVKSNLPGVRLSAPSAVLVGARR